MITPSDSPSSPSDYAGVAVQGMDIQAPQADLTAAVEAAGRLTGAGIVYPRSPRQSQSETLLASPQGYGEFDITTGYAGAPGQDGWPNNTEPGG